MKYKKTRLDQKIGVGVERVNKFEIYFLFFQNLKIELQNFVKDGQLNFTERWLWAPWIESILKMSEWVY